MITHFALNCLRISVKFAYLALPYLLPPLFYYFYHFDVPLTFFLVLPRANEKTHCLDSFWQDYRSEQVESLTKICN